MIIVTAADKKYGNFISYTISHMQSLGYKIEVYNLGDLGFGYDWEINDEDFVKKGYYHLLNETWPTRALHKPHIIKDCLLRNKEFTVYIDADAVVVQNIDEIVGDYDIGVTIRRQSELEENIKDYEKLYRGRINAGVLFFNYTETSLNFIDRWISKTTEVYNDQYALNLLAAETNVKEFPSEIYNYCYFPETPGPEAKIYHYRQGLWQNLFKPRQ